MTCLKTTVATCLLVLFSTLGFAQPVVSYSQSSIVDSVSACGDSVTIPFTIYNTGSGPLSIWLSDGHFLHDTLYSSNISTDVLRKIDPASFSFMGNSGAGIDFSWAVHLTPDGSQLWVTDNWWDSTYVYSTVDLSLIGTVYTGDGSDGVAFTPDGQYAVVASRWDDLVSLVDVNTLSVLATLSVDYATDVAITSDGEYAIVVAAGATNGNLKIRMSDFTVVSQITTNSAGDAQVVLTPDDRYALTGRGWDSEIAVIDVETFTEVAVFTTPSVPIGCDVTPDGKYVYFVDRGTSFLRKVRISDLSMTSVFMPQVNNARDLEIDQFGEFMYMGATDGYVYKIDVQSETVVDTLYEPGSIRGLELLRSDLFWLSQDSNFFQIAAGDSAVVQLTLGSDKLLAGAYSGYLFTRSDDPSSPLDSIPVNFSVNGDPGMLLSASCVDFDTVYQYATTSSSFEIINDGCDTLNVSTISSSLSEYTTSPSSGVVLPDDTLVVSVTFTTTGTGSFPGTLTVQTDVGDSTLCLNAVSVPGPDMSFTPTVINAVSSQCDDTLNYGLMIYNSGAQALIGSLGYSEYGTPTLQEVLDSLNASYTQVTAEVPSIYFFSDGITGTSISDGGGDMYDGGNRLNTDLGFNIPYSNGVISPSSALGSAGQYFTFKGNGLFVFAADLDGVSSFDIQGNLGADGSGFADTALLRDTLGPTVYTGYVKRVYGAGDPSVNHLIIVEQTPGVQHLYATNTNDDYHEVTGLNSVTRIYYLLYARSGGGYIDNAATRNIMGSFLDLIMVESEFITLDTLGVDVAAGDSQLVTIQLTTAGLIEGNYTEYVILTTNDPVNPVDSVEVNLDFNGQAELVLDTVCMGFDSIFQYATADDSLWFTNTGCDTLVIDSFAFTDAAFTRLDSMQWILPGDTGVLKVQFAPTTVGSFTDSLLLHLSTGDTSICLSGEALVPPVLGLSPTLIDTVLTGCDDTLFVPITISNSGAAPLTFQTRRGNTGTSMVLDSILSRIMDGSSYISDAIPNRFDFSEGVTGNRIIDGGSDMYDFGNYLYTTYGSYVTYSNDAIQSSTLFGTGGRYFTHKGTGLFVMAADMNNVSAFYIDGGTGHDNTGTVDTLDFIFTYSGVTYQAFVKRVYGETEPSVNHIMIVEYNGSTYDWYSTGVYNDDHRLYNLSAADRLYLMVFGSQNGGLVTRNQMFEIIQRFVETIHGENEWVMLAPAVDTVAASGSLVAQLRLTSSGLIQGNYASYVAFQTNDPVTPNDTVFIQLQVDGSAQLGVGASPCVMVDTTFQFGTTSDSVSLTNTGCDTLVIDSLYASSGAYALTLDTTALLPGDTVWLRYDFSPLTTGSFADTFYLQTNIGDSSICAVAEVIPPPTISISPSFIDTVALTCDDTLTIPLTVYNTGASDLEYSISETALNPNLSLDSVLARMQNHSIDVSQQVPNRFDFSDGVTDYRIIDGGSDMYDYGNYLQTNLGGYIFYSNNTISGSPYLGSSGSYFTHKGTGLFVLAADLDGVSTFYVTGGTGHDNSASAVVDTLDMVMDFGGRTYRAFIKRVYGETEPSVNHMFIVEDTLTTYDWYSASSSSDAHYLYNLDGLDRLYYLVFSAQNGGLVTRSAMRNIFRTFLETVHGGESWMAISPETDTIAPGDSTVHTVTLTSSGLWNGVYQSYFVFHSNDPVTPTDSIPITLDVQGDEALSLGFSGCLMTDTTFQFGTFGDSFMVYNTGCDTLFIDSLYTASSYLDVGVNANFVLPGDSTGAGYTFSPTVAAVSADTLQLSTSLGDTVICITTIAVPPPTLWFDPASIDTMTTLCDDTLIIPLRIANVGSSNLTYSISESSPPESMALDSVLDRLSSGSMAISSVIPSRYDFTEGFTSIRIVDGGSDMYDFGNYMYTNLGSYINYTNNTLVTNEAILGGSDYFTYKGTGLFVFGGNLSGVNTFYITGGTGHDNNSTGFVDTFSIVMDFAGETYLGLVKRVYGETEPSVNHLIIAPYDASITQDFSNQVYSDYHSVTGLTSTDRLYSLVFGSASGGLITKPQFEEVMLQFLQVIQGEEAWMEVSNEVDTIASGDTLLTDVQLISTGLNSGVYNGSIYIVSNDPLTPIDTLQVQFELDGTPILSTSLTACLDFDTMMQYTSALNGFMLYNTGCDTLFIDSITSDLGFADFGGLDTFLLGYDSLGLPFTFTPTDTGQLVDSIRIWSNVGSPAYCADVYAYPPPVIDVDTDTVSISLYGCCDTFYHEVSVGNLGASDLYFNVTSNSGNSLEDVRTRFAANYADVVAEVPSSYNFTDSPGSNYISDGGNDMYDGGNYISTNFASNIFYSYGGVSASTAFGTSGAYFTTKVDGMWIMAADLDGVSTFQIDGNLGADGSGAASFSTVTATHYGVEYTGYIKRVYGTSDPSVNHLVIVPTAGGISQSGSTNTNDDNHAISGLAGTERIYYLLYAGTSGLFINDAEAESIMAAFLDAAVGHELIVDITPTSDTVQAGDSSLVQVAFAPCEVDTGMYFPALTFTSNDPLTPTQTLVYAISREDQPPAPAVADTAICFGDSTPVFTAIGQQVTWYDDTALSNVVDTGSTFDTNLTAVGSYSFYVTQTLNGCESLVDTLVFEINTPPVAVSVDDTFGCEGGTIPDLIANGNNVYWFSDMTLDTLLYVGDTFATGESAFGYYDYYLFDSVGGCPASPVDTVTLFIDSVPDAPFAPDTLICIGDPAPVMTATGDSVHWYSDPALTSLLSTNQSYTPSIGVPGNYNFYIVQVDTLTECFSPYGVVTLTVQASPAAPTTFSDTACAGDSIPPLQASGSNLKWYSDTSLSTQVASGDSFQTGMTAAGSYTYYVTQTVGTCEGPYASATLVISAPPVLPTALDTAICLGDTVPDLTASSTGLRWYADTALSTLLHVGDTFGPTISGSGEYRYYVTQFNNGCESDADTATLLVHALPSVPVASDTFSCFGQPTPTLHATGAWNQWYSNSTLTSLVDTGDSFATGQTAVGSYTYYVTDLDSVTGCESGADTVSLVINNAPTQPTATDTAVCHLSTVPDLIASGTYIRWYSDTALSNLVSVGDTFTSGITAVGSYNFYVTDSLPGCPQGPVDTATLVVLPRPMSFDVPDTAICVGDSVPPLVNVMGNNDTYWYSDSALSTLEGVGDTLITGASGVGVYTYFAVRDSGSCLSDVDTVSLTIFGIPPAPAVADSQFCEGSAEVPLVAVGTNVRWYSDSALTALVAAGDSLYSGQSSSGSYTYYATQGANGCEGPSSAATLSIITLPSAPAASDTAICDGDTIPALTAIGAGLRWYDDTSLLNLIDTGTIHLPAVSGAGTYALYVTQTMNGCEGSEDTATLVVHALPSPPQVGDTSICESDTLPMFSAIGTSLRWYADSLLATLLDTGNAFSPVDTAVGVYSYFVTETQNGCEGLPDTFTMEINAAPSVPVTFDSSICAGEATPLFTATGTNLTWSDTGLIVLDTGGAFLPSDSIPGTYYYLVSDSLPGCPASQPDTATFVIHPIPGVPTTSDTTVCYGQTVPALTAVGSNVEWFSDSALTTLEATGSSFATGQSSVGVYTYYVRQTINGCIGPAQSVTLSIAPVPAVPSADDTVICEGEPAVLVAAGTNLQWYADATLDTLIATGDSLVQGGLPVGVTTFFVTDSLTGCPASSPDSATVTVNAIPNAPSAADTAVCYGNTPVNILSTGNGVRWYADSGLTSLIDTGNVFQTLDTAVGLHRYYFTQDSLGCQSQASEVQFTVIAIPASPVGVDTMACEGDTVPDLVAVGQQVAWYSDAAKTTLLDTGLSFASGDTASGSYTYWITQTVDGCESDVDSVTLVIHPLPLPPSLADTAICFGAAIPVFIAGDTAVRWYDASGLLQTGDTFQPAITSADTFAFYTTSTANGCEGPRDSFLFVVHPIPAAPLMDDTAVCETDSLPVLTAIGTAIRWYDDAAMTTLLDTGGTFDPGALSAGVHVYFATQTISGCEGASDSITLQIDAQPLSPDVADTIICEGDSMPSFIATGDSITWYDDTLSAPIASGDTFVPSVAAPGSYTYYVRRSAGLCESTADSFSLTILPTPSAPVTSDTTVCEGDTVPPLLATGTSVRWYNDTVSGLVLSLGDTFHTGMTAADTHTFYVTQSAAGCESPFASSSLIIHPLPSAPGMFDTSACFGDTAAMLVASGVSITWYDDAALSSQVDTGSSFTPSVTAVGTYTFYATQTQLGCEGQADSAVYTIHPIPSAPAAEDTTYCLGAGTVTLNASGTLVSWYADAGLDTLLATGATFSPSISSAGTHDFFITETQNGCESEADTVVVLALAEPAIVSIDDTAVCEGDALPTFNAGSAAAYWYDNASITNAIDSGATFTPAASGSGTYTYWVRLIENGCEGDTTSFTLTINALPTSPVMSDSQFCAGDSAVLVAQGSGILWYDDASLTSVIAAGDTLEVGALSAGTYWYFATQEVAGCVSEVDSASITMLSPPPAPEADDTVICEGLPVPPLQAAGQNVRWYADAALDSLLDTGTVFQPSQTAVGMYSYFATQTSGVGCESVADTVMLTITDAPNAPLATDHVVCEGEVVPLILAQGVGIQWYADTGLTQLLSQGSVLDTNLSIPGTYHFYATQTENGCSGPADTASIAIVPIPTAPTVGDTSICFGAANPVLTLNANARWYDNESMLIPIHEGDSFAVEASAVGEYTYYVTQQDSGCESAADTVVFSIHPRPLVTLNTYEEVIIAGDSVYLKAHNAVAYSWSPAAGLSAVNGAEVMASPGVTTEYTVTGWNEEGCAGDTQVTVTVMPLGMAYLLADEVEFNVFPNPNRGRFTVALDVPVRDDYTLLMVNALGEVVEEVQIRKADFAYGSQWSHRFDHRGLSAGVYLLHLRSAFSVHVVRVILQ